MRKTILLAGLLTLLGSCKHLNTEFCDRPIQQDTSATVTRIMFGSCSSENKDQPILTTIAGKQPDLFIYLGDNIYGDTEDMDLLRSKYARLSCKPEFQQLLGSTTVLATWDDHDYGENDAGLDYPQKEASKQIFLEFWNEPAGSSRWTHPGIYHNLELGDSAHRVQIILLDMRTFRTPLSENTSGSYVQDNNPASTFLGGQQWLWLEQQLQRPAQLRLICSSTQFGTEYNGMETWANFPLEQQRMFELIRQTQAGGVMFISGDVHYGELSMHQEPQLYPIYDFTSSGLTQIDGAAANNVYRIGNAFMQRNAGMIEINWSAADPEIRMVIIDETGNEFLQQTIPLSVLSF